MIHETSKGYIPSPHQLFDVPPMFDMQSKKLSEDELISLNLAFKGAFCLDMQVV